MVVLLFIIKNLWCIKLLFLELLVVLLIKGIFVLFKIIRVFL